MNSPETNGQPKHLSFANNQADQRKPTATTQKNPPTYAETAKSPPRPAAGSLDDIEITMPEPTKYQGDITYSTLRYWMIINTQAGPNPTEQFCKTVKETFQIMQDALGDNLRILTWDPAHSNSDHPIWKTPADIPKGDKLHHKILLGAYFGTFLNLQPNTKTTNFLKVRFGFRRPRLQPTITDWTRMQPYPKKPQNWLQHRKIPATLPRYWHCNPGMATVFQPERLGKTFIPAVR